MIKRIVGLVCCLMVGFSAFTQNGDGPRRLDTALVRFFSGKWSGEGAFANGTKIAADVSFSLSLDSSWLVYEHRDRAPQRYKATSMWGVDGQSGEFLAYCFDNFQGHRQFGSNRATRRLRTRKSEERNSDEVLWKNGQLLLSRQAWMPKAGMYFERFVYVRTGDNSFKMTYETSRDGVSWQLGDWLEFRRAKE